MIKTPSYTTLRISPWINKAGTNKRHRTCLWNLTHRVKGSRAFIIYPFKTKSLSYVLVYLFPESVRFISKVKKLFTDILFIYGLWDLRLNSCGNWKINLSKVNAIPTVNLLGSLRSALYFKCRFFTNRLNNVMVQISEPNGANQTNELRYDRSVIHRKNINFKSPEFYCTGVILIQGHWPENVNKIIELG